MWPYFEMFMSKCFTLLPVYRSKRERKGICLLELYAISFAKLDQLSIKISVLETIIALDLTIKIVCHLNFMS